MTRTWGPAWGTPPPPAGQLPASSVFVESLGSEGLTSETRFGFHCVSSHRSDNASTSFSFLADQCDFSTEVKLLQLPTSTRASSKGETQAPRLATTPEPDYTSTASRFGTWLPKSQELSLGVRGPGVEGRGRGSQPSWARTCSGLGNMGPATEPTTEGGGQQCTGRELHIQPSGVAEPRRGPGPRSSTSSPACRRPSVLLGLRAPTPGCVSWCVWTQQRAQSTEWLHSHPAR